MNALATDFERVFGAPMPASLIAAEIDAMHELCSFDTLAAYIADPLPFEDEREVMRAKCHAAIDAGMARINAAQAARWASEEGYGA